MLKECILLLPDLFALEEATLHQSICSTLQRVRGVGTQQSAYKLSKCANCGFQICLPKSRCRQHKRFKARHICFCSNLQAA
jgi:DNA-directed RNA polymerase subunit RPC12/RpoP